MSHEQGTVAPPPPDSGPVASPPRAYYPLDLDRILHTAGSLFRFAWRRMLGAALVPYAIAYAVMVPVSAAVSPVFDDWLARYENAAVLGQSTPPFPDGLQPWVLLLGAAGIGTVVASAIASAAVINIADAVFRGRPATARGALAVALRRTPAILGGQLLLVLAGYGVLLIAVVFGSVFVAGGGIAAFLGLVVMVGGFAATLFLAVRWSLVQQTIVIEHVGPVDGLSRSWRLVAGSGWRVLGYVLMLGLIGLVVGILVSAIPETALHLDSARSTDVAIGTVLSALAALLLSPVAPLIMMLLYYDLRFRAREAAPQPGEARQAA